MPVYDQKVFPAGRIIGSIHSSVGIDREKQRDESLNLKSYDTTLISQRLSHLHLCYLSFTRNLRRTAGPSSLPAHALLAQSLSSPVSWRSL